MDDFDFSDSIGDAPNVKRSYYQREIDANGERVTLVIETDIELGVRLGTEGAFMLGKLQEACLKRLGETPRVDAIRMVRAPV